MQQPPGLSPDGRTTVPSSLTGPWSGFDTQSTWGGIHVDSARVVGVVNALGVSSRPHSSPPSQLLGGSHLETHSRHHMPLHFTGTGQGYFRIWALGLLLNLLTLGLAYPWGRARRLAWSYGHTEVDGHPLGFHGTARKMLHELALLWALLLLAWMARAGSPWVALAGFGLLALVWPHVYRASLQYRLAQTRWRGLQFRLAGRVRGAYHAQLPLWATGLVPVLLWLAWPAAPRPGWFDAAVVALGLGLLAMGPLLLWNSKKYLHARFSMGPVKVHFHSSPRRFYRMGGRTALMALVTVPPAVVLLRWAVRISQGSPAGGPQPWLAAASIALGLLLALGAVALLLAPLASLRAELQNLLWSHTGNSRVRFKSDLRFWPLWRLWVKNCILLVATLGLYWPFAVVSTHRLRLESITLVTRIELDELVNFIKHHEGHAATSSTGKRT